MSGINKQVMKELELRLEKGMVTYGHEVQMEDNRDFVQEALEEALDASIYLQALLIRIKNKQGADSN